MQPGAIVKNRSFSLPMKFVIATGITTVLVIGHRTFFQPLMSRRRNRHGAEFADDYYTKHPSQNS